LGYLDENKIHDDETFEVSARFKEVDNAEFESIKQIGKECSADYFTNQTFLLFNNGVVKYDGPLLLILTAVIFAIVIILLASVSLTYNSFSISASERLKDVRVMSSVGATPGQRFSLVVFEAMFVSLLSIPIGLAAGLLGATCLLGMTSKLMQRYSPQGVTLVFSPVNVLCSIVISLFTIFVSCLFPALQSLRFTAMSSIRHNYHVKLRKKSLKTSKSTQMIFGFEGVLVLKNVKRNKKRYLTVLT
jgi:putative ABC transport system permease protein